MYDDLRALTEAGLVRRIEPAGSPARYETLSVEQAEVTFWGLCPDCQSSEGSAR